MEPSKELKFGAPSRRKRAQMGEKGFTQPLKPKATTKKKAVADDKLSAELAKESAKVAITPSGPKKVGSEKKTSSGGSYAEAKKRDSDLDSYIKTRNATEKGSREYNEAQNKINRAYGKGPIRKVEPAKTASTGKSAATAMASQSKPQTATLQVRKPASEPSTSPTSKTPSGPVSEKAASKISKIKDRRAKAAGRNENRQENKNNRSASRSFRKNERQGTRADNKQMRMDKREDRQDKRADKKNQRGIDRAGIKQARRAQMGGSRKKAFLGVAKTIAGAVGKLAPEGSKVGNIANTVSGVLDNPLQAGINAIKGQPIAGGQQPAAQAPAAAPAAAPQAGATGQPDQQQTMKRGGGKKSALKDRRSKAKKGRYKAQQGGGTITPEGALQKTYSYNATKKRQERNASQARNKRLKELAKSATMGIGSHVGALAGKKGKNKR